MGVFTWGRIAALTGAGLAAAAVVYLARTERGRALVAQAREKGRELLGKIREGGQSAADSLQEGAQTALGPGHETVEEQPAV
jgi:hypothetical protein